MIQDFREQAERAERLARAINDARTCEALLKYAGECREKAAGQNSSWPPEITGCGSANLSRDSNRDGQPHPAAGAAF